MSPFFIALSSISAGLFVIYAATVFLHDRESDYKYWIRHRCMTEFYEIKDAIAAMYDERQGEGLTNRIIDLYKNYIKKVSDIPSLCGELIAMLTNKEMDMKRGEFFSGCRLSPTFEAGTETGHD